MQRAQTDEELIFAFKQTKDNRLLGILLQRYTLLLIGVCMKYLKNETDAQDCVQQVFLKAVVYIPDHTIDNFGSWIYTVTKNQCFMHLRKEKSKPQSSILEDFLEEREDDRYDYGQEKIISTLEETVEELPQGQKECVKMFYFDKRSYNDIVIATEYSILQVKSYIQNGKRNLKILMEKRLKSMDNG